MRQVAIVIAALMLSAGSPGGTSEAEAGGNKAARARTAKAKAVKAKRARATKAKRARQDRQRRTAAKRRRGKRSYYAGHGVAADSLRDAPVERPSGDVWLKVENFRQEVRVNIYRPDGSFDDAALAELDRAFRCKRTGEVRAVDPRLYETLSVIYDHFGERRVDLVSGFRFQRSEGSRHYHASAMDIRIEGVSGRELYAYAESLDVGGMGIGIYPRAGFVHVDYRAPGEPSYRWTDKSPPDGGAPNKQPSTRWARPKS